MTAELGFLALVAFVAGLVDAVAGGGGLVQVPGLTLTFHDRVPADVFGTNKGSSIAGTFVASIRFLRAGVMPLREATPAALIALPASALGAFVLTILDPSVLRPVVLVLLVAVFGFTLRRPDVGTGAAPSTRRGSVLRALALGATLGFYDGFFGPGTGTFLVFGFVRLLGLDFLRASAAAKLVNLATNAAALALFAFRGHVLWWVVLPMATANVAGALVGTKLALERGAPVVRHVFVAVALAMLTKVAWDLVTAPP